MQLVGGSRGRQLFDGDRGDHAGAEFEHLQNPARRQIRAGQAGRKTDEVLNARRTSGLPAGPKLIERQGGKSFGRGIDGRGNARRPGADNRQIDVLRRAVLPDAGRARQLLQPGIHENAVAAFNHRRLAR